MSVEAILAIVGGVALLIGLFGGGVKAKEIEVPIIPVGLRIISVVTGALLIVIAIALSKPELLSPTTPAQPSIGSQETLPSRTPTTQVTEPIANTPSTLTEPVARETIMKDISANLGWQSTGVNLLSGETVNIQYVSGEIHDVDSIIRGPNGIGWACGDSTCCEPMPNVQRDALIGRVDNDLFLIGDQHTLTVSIGGELQLRINDCDAGLFDNSGTLKVRISR